MSRFETVADDMAEFAVEAISSAQIEVLDVPTGHRFTFTVAERPADLVRILPGTCQARVNLRAELTENEVAMRVWSFAQAEMLKAGHIDIAIP